MDVDPFFLSPKYSLILSIIMEEIVDRQIPSNSNEQGWCDFLLIIRRKSDREESHE